MENETVASKPLSAFKQAQRCDGCSAFALNAKNAPNGECRAHSPKATLMPIPNPIGQISINTYAAWPPVQPDFWCREFFPKNVN